jgi:hypothetical protein
MFYYGVVSFRSIGGREENRCLVFWINEIYMFSMKSNYESRLTPSVRSGLAKLGNDLMLARRKRRMTLEEVSAASGVTVPTIRRLEKGHPGVSLGNLAMVLLALGEQRRIGDLLDMATDDAGMALDAARLAGSVARVSRQRGAKGAWRGTDVVVKPRVVDERQAGAKSRVSRPKGADKALPL